MLVRAGLVPPARFVCPSSGATPDPMLQNGKPVSPQERSNFSGADNLSYSYASPFSAAPGYRLNTDLLKFDFAVMGDKNPGTGGGTRSPSRLTAPSRTNWPGPTPTTTAGPGRTCSTRMATSSSSRRRTRGWGRARCATTSTRPRPRRRCRPARSQPEGDRRERISSRETSVRRGRATATSFRRTTIRAGRDSNTPIPPWVVRGRYTVSQVQRSLKRRFACETAERLPRSAAGRRCPTTLVLKSRPLYRSSCRS